MSTVIDEVTRAADPAVQEPKRSARVPALGRDAARKRRAEWAVAPSPRPQEGAPVTAPVQRAPEHLALSDPVEIVQRWDALILQVFSERRAFIARLIDRTERTAEIEAELDFDELTPDDLNRVVPGAVFYWNIGFRNERNGRRVRESWMRFRRLPPVDVSDVAGAEADAAETRRIFGWD